MAIAPGLPGLQVTIAVAGEALQEYDYDSTDTGNAQPQDTIRKYIEAPSGAEFEIRTLYVAPFEPPLPVHVDIMLDGDYTQAPYVDWGGKDEREGYCYGQAASMHEGQSHTQNFQFAELNTEETDQLVTDGVKRQITSIGQIVLYFYFTEHLQEFVPVEVPTSTFGHSAAISQKALKAMLTPGDALTHQTSLSTPTHRELVNYHRVQTSQNEPFATFTFYYRSTATLKSLGIIPRTPTPSPEPEPVPKDPGDMDEAELRAELIRIRNEQQHATVRVKRERERKDSAVTLGRDEDDDDEVVWIGSQPKRVRRSPGVGDVVVELGE